MPTANSISPTSSATFTYPVPSGTHLLPLSSLDLRPDADIDADLTSPPPPDEHDVRRKHIWFFWHSGYSTMPDYTKRTVRTYHRRFSRAGWVMRVVDCVAGSPLHIRQFVPLDRANFPAAFLEERVEGRYARQHVSDLVRFPLLLRYGGVYVDVGLMPIGDLDAIWEGTILNQNTEHELFSHIDNDPLLPMLCNYCLGCLPGNPYIARCHRLLLALWSEHGGRTSTDGMHASPLLAAVPIMGGAFEIKDEHGRLVADADQTGRLLTDYIAQGQIMRLVLGLVDSGDDDDKDSNKDRWNGPEYLRRKVYAIDFMVGSQFINDLTDWDGRLAYDLLSLPLPAPGMLEKEDERQRRAREIVEQCLSRSFAFKLAHGLILRVFGVTLGSLWRDNPGSDTVQGTYADWLRKGMIYLCPDRLPECSS